MGTKFWNCIFHNNDNDHDDKLICRCLIQKYWQTLNSQNMLLKVLLPKSATCKTQNRALIAGIDSLKKQISMWLLNNCYQHFLITFGLESDSHLPKKLFYSLQRKPFKIDRNTFYFILKALFVFKYLSFREDFLAM